MQNKQVNYYEKTSNKPLLLKAYPLHQISSINDDGVMNANNELYPQIKKLIPPSPPKHIL